MPATKAAILCSIVQDLPAQPAEDQHPDIISMIAPSISASNATNSPQDTRNSTATLLPKPAPLVIESQEITNLSTQTLPQTPTTGMTPPLLT
jgi:hypothetical protein